MDTITIREEFVELMVFEPLLTRIKSGDKPQHDDYSVLSDLSLQEANSVLQQLAGGDLERRREFLLHLIDIAGDDVAMDFTQVFTAFIHDKDYMIRSLAISGLWECERSDLIADFIGMIKNDESDTVRISAAIALGRFTMLGANGNLKQEYNDRIELTLMEIMNATDPAEELWRHCLEAVAPYNARGVEDSIKYALNSGDYLLRISGLQAASRSSKESWLQQILPHLKDSESSVRTNAAKACGELETDEAVLYLLPLIQDENEEVRMTALRSLATIGGDFVNKILSEQQDSDDEDVAEFAKRVLSGEGFEEDTML